MTSRWTTGLIGAALLAVVCAILVTTRQINDSTWATAQEKGRTMSLEQAIAYALEETV